MANTTIPTNLIQQPATGGAKDVMMVIAVNADGSPISGGRGGPVDWDAIENKPAVIAAGDTQAAARAAIGAGTSNLVLGTTATTALAGDTVIPSGNSLVPAVDTNGHILRVVDNKPTWSTEVTYTPLSSGDAATGTSNAAHTISAKVLADAIAERIPEGGIPAGGTNGQVLKIVADAPAWAADTNTTYAAMTQAAADAGTSTTANTINALVLKTTIDNALAPLIARIEALEAVEP